MEVNIVIKSLILKYAVCAKDFMHTVICASYVGSCYIADTHLKLVAIFRIQAKIKVKILNTDIYCTESPNMDKTTTKK